MIKKVFISFGYAKQGLLTVWKEEYNFRIEVIFTILILGIMYYFNFSLLEFIICIIAMTFILSAEIVNTAIEDVCNKIEPNRDPAIGKIKDTMAGFVFITVISGLTIGFLVFYNHFLL